MKNKTKPQKGNDFFYPKQNVINYPKNKIQNQFACRLVYKSTKKKQNQHSWKAFEHQIKLTQLFRKYTQILQVTDIKRLAARLTHNRALFISGKTRGEQTMEEYTIAWNCIQGECVEMDQCGHSETIQGRDFLSPTKGSTRNFDDDFRGKENCSQRFRKTYTYLARNPITVSLFKVGKQ